jgi:DNA repair/transcription protein MET18/MMS19
VRQGKIRLHLRFLHTVPPFRARASTQRCRIAALRCLGGFPDVVRFESLQNVKAAVIRDLALALDDPKRMVRKEAVDSRAKWSV